MENVFSAADAAEAQARLARLEASAATASLRVAASADHAQRVQIAGGYAVAFRDLSLGLLALTVAYATVSAKSVPTVIDGGDF